MFFVGCLLLCSNNDHISLLMYSQFFFQLLFLVQDYYSWRKGFVISLNLNAVAMFCSHFPAYCIIVNHLIFYYFFLSAFYFPLNSNFLIMLSLLNSEFQLIHELCLYVLSASQRTELIRATLDTLNAFLSWIPLGYIFESPLVCTLLTALIFSLIWFTI